MRKRSGLLGPTGPLFSYVVHKRNGMTLIEILVTMLIASIVTGTIYTFLKSEQKAYRQQYQAQERDQTLRFAMNTFIYELMGAGYHAVGDGFIRNLAAWLPVGFKIDNPMRVHPDANPKITFGGDGCPDMISFFTVLPTETGSTSLKLPSVDALFTVNMSKSKVRDQFKIGDLVCIGAQEVFARVAEVNAQTLTLDTDPLVEGNQTPVHPFPAGTELGEISLVTYAVFNDINDPTYSHHEAGCPELKRKVNAGSFQPVAENISDLQLSVEADGRIRIVLTALLDPITGGAANDDLRGRKTEVQLIRLRNCGTPGTGYDCDIPETPDNLIVQSALSADSACKILLAWEGVTLSEDGKALSESRCEVKGYRIFYDVVAGAFGRHVDVDVGAEDGYELNVKSLPSGIYYVSVAAVNESGIGKRSDEVIVRDQTSPASPSNLKGEMKGNSVLLEWLSPGDCDLSGFRIFRKSGKEGVFKLLPGGIISAGTTHFLDANPPSGISCEYAVRSEDYGFNQSAMSDPILIDIPELPLAEAK
jgi:prepilin-type N-terminal cleavage/methylation domain-containing protein